MSDIYLKVTIEKTWHTQNFEFLSLKIVSRSVFGDLQLTQISLIFKLVVVVTQKSEALFFIILISKGIMT